MLSISISSREKTSVKKTGKHPPIAGKRYQFTLSGQTYVGELLSLESVDIRNKSKKPGAPTYLPRQKATLNCRIDGWDMTGRLTQATAWADSLTEVAPLETVEVIED
jgi:hypothetical protein